MAELPSRPQDRPSSTDEYHQAPEYSTWNLQPQDYRDAFRAAKAMTQKAVDVVLDSDAVDRVFALTTTLLLLSRRRAVERDTAISATADPLSIDEARRQALRHAADVDYERLTFPRPATPRVEETFRELGAPTMELQKLEFAKPGRTGPYADWNDFVANGLQSQETVVRKYSVKGYPHLSITVEEDYAKKLDEVRQLRFAADALPLNAEEARRQQDARDRLAEHPLRQAVLPEDVVARLHELPNPSLVLDVVLRGSPNPQDVWHAQTYDKGFISAATAHDSGTISFYPSQQTYNLGRNLRHEWAHLLEAHCVGRSEFNDAAIVERDGFYMGSYPRRNDRENWAVHFEELTDHDADRFLNFCNEAPVRAYAMCEGLREALGEATIHSPYEKQLLARVDYFEQHVRPKAVDALTATLKNYDEKNLDSVSRAGAATSLLFEMNDMRAVDALTEFAKTHPEAKCARTAFAIVTETLKLHAPEQLPKFLNQFLDSKYPWKGEAALDLRIASLKSQDARDVLANYQPTELVGKVGPGVEKDVLENLRRVVDETGVPIVIYGSRQTGWSEPKQRPFTKDSDYDIGVIGVENFDKLMNHPAFKSGEYKKNDIPGVHHPPAHLFDTEQEAVDKGYLVIRPKFDTRAIVAALDHDAMRGLPVSRSAVLEFLRSQVGPVSSLNPYQQEQITRITKAYREGDLDTVKAVQEALGLQERATAGDASGGTVHSGGTVRSGDIVAGGTDGGTVRRPVVEPGDRSRTALERQADERWREKVREVRESGVMRGALERANFPADRARELELGLLSGEHGDVERARREIESHLRESGRDREAFRKALGEGEAKSGGKLGSIAIVVGALLPYVFPNESN